MRYAAGMDEALALYEKLVATRPDVEREGKTVPCTSRGGHMFSFLTPEGEMALRLDADDRDSFLRKYRTQLCVQHGRVLREYVVVPRSLLEDTADLQEWFDRSWAYAGTLDPDAAE